MFTSHSVSRLVNPINKTWYPWHSQQASMVLKMLHGTDVQVSHILDQGQQRGSNPGLRLWVCWWRSSATGLLEVVGGLGIGDVCRDFVSIWLCVGGRSWVVDLAQGGPGRFS